MATHTITAGVCYLDIYDTVTVTITGSSDPTADIPYIIFTTDVARIQETPVVSTTAYWTSKDFDMSDQNPPYQNMTKTIDRIQLEYVDESADTPVAMSISTDGGATWAATTTRLLGTGDGRTKVSDFWFLPVTGKFFRVKLESTSTNKSFTWTGLFVHYYVRGDYFEVTT